MRIGDVAQRSGVAASAIRYYESIGLLPEPERESGQRRYGEEALRLLHTVEAAKRGGFSLGEIRELLAAGRGGRPVGTKLSKLARHKLIQVNASIERAQRLRRWLEAATGCDCRSVDECALLGSAEAPACR